tara:strand:+ start:641 stop:1279 length:639 start_codon:yes stop_codon:yes gene_type:complete
MATIDIDVAQKVNIEAHYANSFNLYLEVKNEDGTDYDFTGQIVVFTIYDSDSTPLKIATSLQDGTTVSGSPAAGDEFGFQFPFYKNTRLNTEPNYIERRLAVAFSNLYNCNIEIFKFDGKYKDFVCSLPLILLDDEDDQMRLANLQSVRFRTDRPGFEVNIPYGVMNIKKGSYNYDVKIISDMVVETDYTRGEINSYWKNSSTWMKGKFVII